LKKNKEVVTLRVRTAGGSTNPVVDTSMQSITYSGIETDTWGDATADNEGFLTQGDKFLYQGLINVKCYGGFILEGDLLNNKTSKKYCISSKESDVPPLVGDEGLPNELTKANVEKCAQRVGGDTPFKIGVGLNFDKFVIPFFQKFFP
jgi:hypothetical protein